MLYAGQQYNAKNLATVHKNATYNEFRCHRALFSWMGNTRPNVAFCANQAAQISWQTFSREKPIQLIRGTRRFKNRTERGLSYPKLDLDNLDLRVMLMHLLLAMVTYLLKWGILCCNVIQIQMFMV